jgi:hypothetical protein
LWAFIDSNHFDISKEVCKKRQEYNVPKKDLVVEIDFHGDAPALRNGFKVRLNSDFFEESALVDAPGWFQTVGDKKAIERYLRKENERASSDDLLVLCRASNGAVKMHSMSSR